MQREMDPEYTLLFRYARINKVGRFDEISSNWVKVNDLTILANLVKFVKIKSAHLHNV